MDNDMTTAQHQHDRMDDSQESSVVQSDQTEQQTGETEMATM